MRTTTQSESGIAQIQILLKLVTGVTVLTWGPKRKAKVRGFKASFKMCVINNIEIFRNILELLLITPHRCF